MYFSVFSGESWSRMCIRDVIFFILLFLQCFADEINNIESKASRVVTRIVGGQPTNIETYPFIAQMLLNTNSIKYMQICSAIIVTNRYLISVAHCFQFNVRDNLDYSLPKYWLVRYGTTCRSSGNHNSTVQRIINHPAYNTITYENDISVVHINNIIQMNNYIRQARISLPHIEVNHNRECTLIGWGSAYRESQQSELLRSVNLYTIDTNICRNRYNRLNVVISDSMMCAGRLDIGGADGCMGDSGGPLINNGIVIGIVSFGYTTCGHSYYPGVFTKLSYFTNWVIAMIK